MSGVLSIASSHITQLWSVGDGAEPRIQLVPGKWDMNTNIISQYKFGMRFYCTTGSGALRRKEYSMNRPVPDTWRIGRPVVGVRNFN